MRVSSLQGSLENLLSDSLKMTWVTVFESSVCIPPSLGSRRTLFNGMENSDELNLIQKNDSYG